MSLNRNYVRPPGFPCPQCQTRLVVDAYALLAGQAVVCGACGLELTVDREASAETLAALGEHLHELDAVEEGLAAETRDFTPAPGRSRRRSPPRRPRRR